jgi:hypothetical protein
VLRAAIVLAGIAAALVVPRIASADEDEPIAETDAPLEGTAAVHHVEPPPPPGALGRELLLDIRGAAVVPVYVGGIGGICPGGHECVMNAGVGIGVTVEQRWPDRVGLLLSYDAWVVDSDSIYEIGLMHSFRIGLRYVLDASLNVHPFLEASVGFLAFGDTSQVAAVGGAVTAGGGAEVEISDSIAMLVDAELWTFATGSFETRDGIRRSDGFGANLAVQISVGIEVLLGTL